MSFVEFFSANVGGLTVEREFIGFLFFESFPCGAFRHHRLSPCWPLFMENNARRETRVSTQTGGGVQGGTERAALCSGV